MAEMETKMEEQKPDSTLVVPTAKDLKRFGVGIITYISIVVGGVVGMASATYILTFFLTKLFGA